MIQSGSGFLRFWVIKFIIVGIALTRCFFVFVLTYYPQLSIHTLTIGVCGWGQRRWRIENTGPGVEIGDRVSGDKRLEDHGDQLEIY